MRRGLQRHAAPDPTEQRPRPARAHPLDRRRAHRQRSRARRRPLGLRQRRPRLLLLLQLLLLLLLLLPLQLLLPLRLDALRLRTGGHRARCLRRRANLITRADPRAIVRGLPQRSLVAISTLRRGATLVLTLLLQPRDLRAPRWRLRRRRCRQKRRLKSLPRLLSLTWRTPSRHRQLAPLQQAAHRPSLRHHTAAAPRTDHLGRGRRGRRSIRRHVRLSLRRRR